MSQTADDTPTTTAGGLAEIEREAASAAREAGALLMDHFGGPLRVDYKDERRSDPVTEADRRSQALLAGRIRSAFPGHAIVGEEDEASSDDPLPDHVWVLDPLDGTRNFSQGLPIFACSVGVMHRGRPVAGAIFIPWPGTCGRVLHAAEGRPASWDGEPVEALARAVPESRRLAGLPGGFGYRYRFDASMRRRAGEPRQIGSIAYEAALVAAGVFQYSALTGSLSLWDVAAASVIVPAAGGTAMIGDPGDGEPGWRGLRELVSGWSDDPPSAADLRRWHRPMIFGAPGVADAVAAGMRPRARWARRIRRSLP